jgi:hypothetical protein
MLLLVAAACAPQAAKQVAAPALPPMATPAAMPTLAPSSGEAAPGALPPQPGAEKLAERMVISKATLALVVKDTDASMESIKSLVAELKGYITEAKTWKVGEQTHGQATIRVPAESLNDALKRIKALAIKVQKEEVTGEDVTEEYTDLGAQLKNLEATENELRELLATVRQKTGKAEDILAVYRELTQIRGQIEQVKGRMQYLEKLSAMATISIGLTPEEAPRPVVEEGWRPDRTVRDALRTLVTALQFLADLGIWIVGFVLPIMLVLLSPFIVLWVIWRTFRRRKPKSP